MPIGRPLPRLMIAGLAGGSGKTLVAMGLLAACRHSGVSTRAFKKGPDYIDAAWLAWASGARARNLDSYLMGFDVAVSSFAAHATPDGLNLIEANRGVFDGMDAAGTHSSAALARALGAPVLLVLNITKVTRTAAAFVLGARALDPELNVAGVVLNCVGGRRHEQIVRDSIQSACGVPVVGAIPRLDFAELVPERHLGLVTPEEFDRLEALERKLAESVAGALDVQAVLRIARSAPPLSAAPLAPPRLPDGAGLRIGYLRDPAFSFYYAENLEALERAGAELVAVSALTAAELPGDLHALYIGGGFPETHAAALASNQSFLSSVRDAAQAGLPIYAECGGLMLLARNIVWRGTAYPMADVFPFDALVHDTAQGHGYTELLVDRPNPFFPTGTALKGHEFHYSRIALEGGATETCCAVRRGTGVGGGRDGVVTAGVFAAYTHLHALATPEWAAGVLEAARRFRASPPDRKEAAHGT
jgi:cobyrinic acid a,c-diamide synthase